MITRSAIMITAFLMNIGMALNAQNVNIPDPYFKGCLLSNFDININADNEIQVSEAAAFAGEINCSGFNITDLTGIEAFIALTSLVCDYNELTSLDVSANTALTRLSCDDNQLTALDVSANNALTELNCNHNQLTSLDVSANNALTVLDCGGNQLTLLDVSANTALTELYCGYSELTSLDVSANTALTVLDCGDNPLTSLNVSANTALTWLICYDSQLTSLNVSANTALILLWCEDNQLTSLDVSANNALASLDCSGNQLTSLNLSANTALIDLFCYNNPLTSLNLSANTALIGLWCDGNHQLTSLNVQNGNNTSFEYFYATNNPNLTCIQVDDVAYSTTNWTDIDATASFSLNCGTIGIPEQTASNRINAYPNPTIGIVYFSEQTNVQLTNATGQLIAARKNINTLDISDQPVGIYFITHIDSNGQMVQRSKVVKE